MTVGGSPITGSGTLAFSFNSQSAASFLASPSGSSGVPSFRTLSSADIPALTGDVTTAAGVSTYTGAILVTNPSVGMVGDGVTDNGPKIAALMTAVAPSPGGIFRAAGETVVFPGKPGTVRNYLFNQPLDITRSFLMDCGNGAIPDYGIAGTALVFAAGVDGLVFHDPNTALDGGAAYGSVSRNCAVYSLSSGAATFTAGGAAITGLNMNGANGVAPYAPGAGDAIIAWSTFDYQNTFITGSVSGTTLTIVANTSGPVAVGDKVYGNSGIPDGTVISQFLTGTGFAGTYQLSNPGNVPSTTALTIVAYHTTPLVPHGAFLSAVSGTSATLGGSYVADATAIARAQGSGAAAVWVLPAAQAYSITSTSGSPTVTVTAGPRPLAPGDLVWSDIVNAGIMVWSVNGLTFPQTVTFTATTFADAGTSNAQVTHAGGTGKLWKIPQGIKREVQSTGENLSVAQFPIGEGDNCSAGFTPSLNCTHIMERSVSFFSGIIGRNLAGDNPGGSVFSMTETARNYFADLYNGSLVGNVYDGQNDNSSEGGTAPYFMVKNCNNQGYDTLTGYSGGQDGPSCGVNSAWGANPGNLAISAPMLISAPGAAAPLDQPIIKPGRVIGDWTFQSYNNGPSVEINTTPNAAFQSMLSKDGGTRDSIAQKYNPILNTIDYNQPGLFLGGNGFATWRFPTFDYTARPLQEPSTPIAPFGLYIGGDALAAGTECLSYSVAGNISPGTWTQPCDNAHDVNAVAGGSFGSLALSSGSGATIRRYGPVSNDSAGTDWTYPTVRVTAPLWINTAPTISSGFCVAPSVSPANGTASFIVNVGSACAASAGVLTMPAATNGWNCNFTSYTANATSELSQSGIGTATTVPIISYVRGGGGTANFTSADKIGATCSAY